MNDRSNGYEAIAASFMAQRSPSIGVGRVQEWARCLPPETDVLDLGCGHGLPMARALANDGFRLFGVDASPTLLAAYQKNIPQAVVDASPAEASSFFNRSFHAVLAWGLLFLLSPEDQELIIRKAGATLYPGGRFLFTAPDQAVSWSDALTGRMAVSLGCDAYRALLDAAGMYVEDEFDDDGGNHYYSARKAGQATPPAWPVP